jgi:8-oxo-dGTP pyrophosphatase MutT (NUDIX family)
MTTLASGIILYRREGGSARLLLLRSRDNGHWGFPKGRRDDGDAHEVDTALRELAEETGYGAVALHPGFRAELSYVANDPVAPYPKRVTYFLAEAPPAEPRLSAEHDEARWASAEEAERLLRHAPLRELARTAVATALANGAGG